MDREPEAAASGEARAGPPGGLDRSNTIRAGVFGIQDGIVSNFGLIMGVAGAQISPEAVLVAGVAGLVSGALSMGAGEYVSVRTQAELLDAEGVVRSEEDNVSPVRAAAANGLLFVAGGAIPLVPFLLTTGMTAVAVSSLLSVIALFTAGAVLTRLTRRSAWRSGMRLLVIGGGAGVVGFLVGTALGATVG
ncbi:MAG: VIT1/CCC1 transporter family protein [Nitriliruptoraceae bacterium]|nr:VIT1/CCC1 transporter family protein [Nitriliruptoraceae bacterium]